MADTEKLKLTIHILQDMSSTGLVTNFEIRSHRRCYQTENVPLYLTDV